MNDDVVQDPLVGLGHWRGQAEAPEPAAPHQGDLDGPPLTEPAPADAAGMDDRMRALLPLIAAQQPDEPDGMISFNLDGSGNGVGVVYNVAAGMQFRLGRLVLEDGTSTPAAPYTGAGAWVGIYRADAGAAGGAGPSSEAATTGGLRDFAPVSAGGPIFPCLFSDDVTAAAIYKGPCAVLVRVVGGTASRRIVGYFKGELSRVRGLTV